MKVMWITVVLVSGVAVAQTTRPATMPARFEDSDAGKTLLWAHGDAAAKAAAKRAQIVANVKSSDAYRKAEEAYRRAAEQCDLANSSEDRLAAATAKLAAKRNMDAMIPEALKGNSELEALMGMAKLAESDLLAAQAEFALMKMKETARIAREKAAAEAKDPILSAIKRQQVCNGMTLDQARMAMGHEGSVEMRGEDFEVRMWQRSEINSEFEHTQSVYARFINGKIASWREGPWETRKRRLASGTIR